MENFIAAFEKKLHSFFNPKKTLSVQEEAIVNLVNKLLTFPSTDKVTPFDGSTYLVNDELKCCVRIKDSHISIISKGESITRVCNCDFSYYLQEIIDKSVQKDVEQIEKAFFKNELALFERLDTRLSVQ